MMNRIFFDYEFFEITTTFGRVIQPLSVGMVKETGEFYYAEYYSANRKFADDWVKEHVIPSLGPDNPKYNKNMKYTGTICSELIKFSGHKPEFWADWGAYDWIALCQTFGGLMDLPKDWPMYFNDFQSLTRNFQEQEENYKKNLPSYNDKHNALLDAYTLLNRFRYHAECVGAMFL